MEWLKDYLQKISDKRENKRLIIYGAGRVANIILSLSMDHGIPIEGFCVTNLEENVKSIKGFPVWQFDQLSYDPKEALILIGVKERGTHKIKVALEQAGYHNYIEVPEKILDCGDFEREKKQRPVMEITPQIGCSVNCRYCPQKTLLDSYFKKDKKRKSELSFEEYKKILGKLPKNTLIEWAGFVEPFFNPFASDMMVYTYEAGFEQTLFTTLVNMKESDFEKIKEIPFKIVCLHTPDAHGYANIPVTDNYIKLLGNVVNTKNKQGNPFITTANCQSTPHPDILPITSGKIKIYCELSDRAGSVDDKEGKVEHFHKTGRIWCDRSDGLNHNVLLPDGTVVLCCNDFGLKHVIGNLLSDDYDSLMKSKMMRQIKRALTVDERIPVICRNCIFAKSIDE
ncbi:radical SAM/SPASM domain-containing protein [Enterocloster bolteae]|uniref:radical SAM/SPASM domain-containing protein n=1 Tax=Enterocloster bolteae TaxID=208479 RepID=UPI00210EC695|nr:SPASM domain-containing protein [Enterocloster bolteae]MCQ5142940.1 SPASM domain-containing protein [Enterocloster bolteae]